MDYLSRINNSTDRFEIANLIRAFGCQVAAKSYMFSDKDRISIVEEYNRQAETLERDYNPDDYVRDGSLGLVHPYRQWLREWGYTPAEKEAPSRPYKP